MVETRSGVWLLSLIPRIRFGRWWCGAAIALSLLAFFAAAGNFDNSLRSGATPRWVAVFFAVITAYIIPITHFILERAVRALDQLAEPLHLDAAGLDEARRSLIERSPRWNLTYLGAGLILGAAHALLLYSDPMSDQMSHNRSWDLLDLASIFGTMLVWAVMTVAMATLVELALRFSRWARSIPLDLLNGEALTPFGRVAVSSTLAIIGAQAAFPIMSLDEATSAAAMVPGLVATAIPMVMMFALPVWPLHRRIVAAKRAEIDRINQWLARKRTELLPTSPDQVSELAPLLSYRATIGHAQEWPFNTGLLTRLGFYLIIPPLTWVGAALIEMLLEDVV